MKASGINLHYLSLAAVTCLLVISCSRKNDQPKIADTIVEVQVGDWDSIRAGNQYRIDMSGSDADLKFKEHIILASSRKTENK